MGNINHTTFFIRKYLVLVDDILIDDTKQWLAEQKDQTVTITLDIGTCVGITLLAVLYICGSEVRLANVLPTNSKKGEKLADLCFEALTVKHKVIKFK